MTQLFLRATPLAELMPRACRHAVVWSPIKAKTTTRRAFFNLARTSASGRFAGKTKRPSTLLVNADALTRWNGILNLFSHHSTNSTCSLTKTLFSELVAAHRSSRTMTICAAKGIEVKMIAATARASLITFLTPSPFFHRAPR